MAMVRRALLIALLAVAALHVLATAIHRKLGKRLVNLEDLFGYLLIPDNSTTEFTTDQIHFTGPTGLYGKSLLLMNVETNGVICASILMVDKSKENSATARFSSPVSGNVHFRWLQSNDTSHSDLMITADLYHVHNKENVSKHEDNCNILQLVFDPDDRGPGKSVGDLDTRLGKLKVSRNYNRYKFKRLYRDAELDLHPGPQRSLYLVLFESKHEDVFLACAKIRYDRPIGARGDLETRIVYSSTVAGYKIHELPVKPAKSVGQNENSCLTTKFVYNPLNIDLNSMPPNGYGTQEQYAVGDLSGKLLGRNNETLLVPGGQELTGDYWDAFLPLQGRYSIVHRSLVIYKNTQYPESHLLAEPWICGSVILYEAPDFKHPKKIFTAQASFRYPTVS
ncbi:unnamed protein product, partial [Callosobruchus maculatus]